MIGVMLFDSLLQKSCLTEVQLYRKKIYRRNVKIKMKQKNGKTLFLSMDVEITKMSILIDEILLTRLDSAELKESTSSSDMEKEIEKLKRILLQIKDLMDAETSVEKWVIDYLLLGKFKGFIFKDEQVPRVENSAVPTWWRQLRLVLDDVREVFYEIPIDDVPPMRVPIVEPLDMPCDKSGIQILMDTCLPIQKKKEISVDVSTITGLRERLHEVINLKPRDPRRIDHGSKNIDGSNEVFGRQEDVKRIIKLLVSNIIECGGTTISSVDDAHVIPIVGDSGIGKTTVAKHVYNDNKVDSHFDWKMWVNLSNQSLGILGVTVTEQAGIISDKHLIFSKIRKSLHGKKFLLVLDGVSNEICCDWVALHVLLMAGANGSRILITTRSFSSSSTLGSVPPYRLQPLSFEDCWELFIYRASRINSAVIPPFQCYRDMLKWFQGFPSLVVALGDFSHSKPNEWDIFRVVDDIKNNNALMHISSTMLDAYHGLPSMHIKQCLLYCALFPKGYRFQKHKLVWLWMAEGFIQPKRGFTIEQVGFQYFDELFFTSFLQLEHEFKHQAYLFYFIPDAVHNFVEYISGNEYFRIDNKETHFSGNAARHLSVHWKESRDHGFKALQTLLVISELDWDTRSMFIKLEKFPRDLFIHLKGLHVLDLSYTGLVELPDSVHHLKHLRFLDLSGNPLIRLPEKLSMLRNLETFIITDSTIENFPRDMGKLISLRHLILGNGCQPFVLPPGIGKLTKLQTLPAFIIGSKSDEGIEDLRELVHLQGSLLILGLNNVPQENIYLHGGWLSDKAYLQQLDLFWDPWYELMPGDPETAENLLAGLQPHTNLVRLQITYYKGLKFPFWLGDPSFSNLETIELCYSRTCESLPPLGQLPFLKSLKVSGMDALKYIDDEFLGKRAKAKRFPSLRTLRLEGLSCLEKWSGLRKGDMHFLEQLEVGCCKMLTSLPTLQFLGSLKELSIRSCPKVESLPEEKLPCSLQSFAIMFCPLLAEKMEKLGEEWWGRKKIKLWVMKR